MILNAASSVMKFTQCFPVLAIISTRARSSESLFSLYLKFRVAITNEPIPKGKGRYILIVKTDISEEGRTWAVSVTMALPGENALLKIGLTGVQICHLLAG